MSMPPIVVAGVGVGVKTPVPLTTSITSLGCPVTVAVVALGCPVVPA